MFSRMIIFFIAVFASIVVAVPAADPTRPAAGAVSVSDITVDTEGSGCRQGQVSVSVVSDNSALTIIFDNFSAADGPNAVGVKTRAFCRITIGMSSPGWAFDITSADFRGYVNLQQGVEASLVSRWKWIDSNGSDLKGKVRALIVCGSVGHYANWLSRVTSTRLSTDLFQMMYYCTRKANCLVASRQSARRRTRNFKSASPPRSSLVHLQQAV